MSCVRSRIRHILPAPALFLALWAVLICSVPAPAAARTNPEGNTITANPGMAATANGERLTNLGTIKSTATGLDYAVGMGDSSFTGLQLTNNGSITASQTGAASAYGMSGGANSTLVNSGTITAIVTGNSALAHGMFGGDDSSLTNHGSITATATGENGGAYGMSGVTSTLINSGTIKASATGDGGSSSAYGMSGDYVSTLINSGAIKATVTTGTAFGMYSGSDYSILTNRGTISASVTSRTGYNNSAYGMLGYSLDNSGFIEASATTGRAFGMNSYADSTNSGAITVNASGRAYGMLSFGNNNSTLRNHGAITASATGNGGYAYGMALYSGTASNFGLIRVSAPDPAKAWELYGSSGGITNTVRITEWAMDLRDFTTYKFFGSDGGKLDLDGSRLTLRPGDKERGFVWGKEYAVADMAAGLGQGAVASVTTEVPWARAILTGANWTDQKISLHPNFTRKTNIGQGVSRQGVAIVMDQMRGMDRALGQFRNSSAPAAFSTASGPSPKENDWSGFLTPYFSHVDNSDLEYDAKIVGFMAGATRRFTERFSAGAHVGFSHADVSADLADQDGEALTGLIGLHAIYNCTPEWYVRGQLTGFLSRASNDWESGLPVYPLFTDADVDSRGVYASLVTGYDWRINASNTLTPELGLSWLWSHQDSYSLKWKDRFGNHLDNYDLDYKAQDYNALYGTAMVRWRGDFALGDSVFRPSLGLGLRQTLTDGDVKSRVTASGSTFTTKATEDETTALAEAGFVWQRGITSVGLTYTGGYGDDQRIHAGWLTLKVAF